MSAELPFLTQISARIFRPETLCWLGVKFSSFMVDRVRNIPLNPDLPSDGSVSKYNEVRDRVVSFRLGCFSQRIVRVHSSGNSFLKKFYLPVNGGFFVDLIAGRPQVKYAWLQRAWLAILFLGGLYLWGRFLNWGRGPISFHDWALIFGPRLTLLREAIIRGELPLHLSAPAIEGDVTRRFLAIPDQILSPQIFLLPWLSVGQFVLLQFWLMYTLGFWALLLLRRRFGLSLLAFTILFTLFNFNGHILAHASIGHANWGGYFLFAGFALLIFTLLDGQANWRWVAKVVFWLLFIFLQGSYHQFIYALFFLGLLALSVPRHFWVLAATSVFAVLVALVRVLPAGLLLGHFKSEFIAGYSLFQSIWQYMTQIQFPNDLTVNSGTTMPVGTWEYTFFVGVPSALFILYFGVVYTLKDREALDHFRTLLLPCLGLTLLSLDKVFSTLRAIFPLPLFTAERVAARIFSLAFVFILIVATVQFQRWLDKNRLSLASVLAMLLLIALSANDLLRNIILWRVANVAYYYPLENFIPALYYPANQYDDTLYIRVLIVGLLLSLTSAAVLLFLAWRERRISAKAHQNG